MNLHKFIILSLIVLLGYSCSSDDDGGGDPVINSVVLTSPGDGLRPVSTLPELTWETYEAEGSVTYTVFLGTSATMLNEFSTDITATSLTITATEALDLETVYFWKVNAYVDGELIAESEVRNFTTETVAPVLLTETAAYSARKGAGMAVFNDKMWVIGGRNEADTPLDDIWSSTNGTNWTNEGSLSFGAIYGHKLIAFNGKLWIYGGIVAGVLSNAIYSSSDGVIWDIETGTTPFTQYQSSRFTVFEDRIYRIAGYDASVEDLSEERNVYSSADGLNWTLETENHRFETKFGFLVETFNNSIYGIEPNPSTDIAEINIRSSNDGVNWSATTTFATNERGITSIGSVVYNNKLILMTTPEGGGITSATFFESINGEDWIPATSIASVPLQAIYFELLNLNGQLFAVGGAQRSNFSVANNTVWSLN
ncbi:hypothetical protein [Aquimarina brevivitae]|uniref:Kelch motif protein n=1 Tax=Aquimarina brevivitae TaxID=323412 RepID=A0A4V2F5N5_9FLAO|nr:hypothetical protein [Aquimarina brevivitae]RZS93439.1 Kelch motif protein [Aquimarina brevivitae]